MKRPGIQSSSGKVEDRTILTAVAANRTGANPGEILGEATPGLRPASASPKNTTCDVAHFHEQCRWTPDRRCAHSARRRLHLGDSQIVIHLIQDQKREA